MAPQLLEAMKTSRLDVVEVISAGLVLGSEVSVNVLLHCVEEVKLGVPAVILDRMPDITRSSFISFCHRAVLKLEYVVGRITACCDHVDRVDHRRVLSKCQRLLNAERFSFLSSLTCKVYQNRRNYRDMPTVVLDAAVSRVH